MADYFIYNHGGSANHGCEALVRTVLNLFQDEKPIPVLTEAPQQDLRYGIGELAPLEPATTPYSKLSLSFGSAYFTLKTQKDYFKMDILPYRKPIKKLSNNMVELSVGGDIYCYEDYHKFILLHEMIAKRGCKSVLLGCSLDKQLFLDPLFIEDMQRFDYISARESLTYDLLKSVGLTNIGLIPDSAFTLEKELLPLPEGFVEGNTIGINLSPLVVRKETKAGIVLENFTFLIRYILENTDCNVALIPHVVWHDNDDRTVLKQLYHEVNCPKRVVMIEDCNCMQLKGFISRCRFFIGARTHATIASYSTCVPTLVLGYSVKSRGIATDLFGTDEHYVLSVQQLCTTDALTESFKWIMNHEAEMRSRLEDVMPGYINKASLIKRTVELSLERK